MRTEYLDQQIKTHEYLKSLNGAKRFHAKILKELYALKELAKNYDDKPPVKNLLPDRDKLLDEAYKNVHCDSDVNYDTVAMADFDSNILDYVLDKIYNVEGNCS